MKNQIDYQLVPGIGLVDNLPNLGLVGHSYLKSHPRIDDFFRPRIEASKEIRTDKRNQIYGIMPISAFALLQKRVGINGKRLSIMNPFEYVEYLSYLSENEPNRLLRMEHAQQPEILNAIYTPSKFLDCGITLLPGGITKCDVKRRSTLKELLDYSEKMLGDNFKIIEDEEEVTQENIQQRNPGKTDVPYLLSGQAVFGIGRTIYIGGSLASASTSLDHLTQRRYNNKLKDLNVIRPLLTQSSP